MVLFISREPLSYFRPYKSYFMAIYVSFFAFPISQLVLVYDPDEFLIRLSAQGFAAAAAIVATSWGLLVTKLYFYPEKFSLRVALVVAFTVYPFVTLSRLRAELKDREVINALRIISLCLACISVLLLVSYSLENFGYNILALAHLATVILLIVVVNAFKKPTFLRAFLGLVPTLGRNPALMRGDQIVLIYGSDDAKITPIARFVNEGVNQQNRVLYFHSNNEAEAREELSRDGVDVKHNLTKGNLRLPSIDSLYQGQNLLDEEAAIGQCQELANETK